jgi:hypothetical protein
MAQSGNGGRAVHQARDEKNQKRQHQDRDQHLDQGKAARAATLFQRKSAYAPESRAL